MCAAEPDVFGASGRDLFGCDDSHRGLWYEFILALSEDHDLAHRLQFAAAFPEGNAAHFTDSEFSATKRALSRLAITPATVRGMGRIGPKEMPVDDAIGFLMTEVVNVLEALDAREADASSRGSRTGPSHQGQDGAWFRSRLSSFVSHVEDGQPDGDCRIGPG